MSDVIVRELVEHDLDLVCRHREAMFRDAGRSDDVLEAMRRPFRTWLQPRLQDGRYFGFIALQKTAPIAGIGLMLIDWPPHPSHPEQDRRGYVLNLYVEAEYRKRGIARALMGRGVCRQWCAVRDLARNGKGPSLVRRFGLARDDRDVQTPRLSRTLRS